MIWAKPLVQHKINTGDATPIRQPPRGLPLHQHQAVRELVSNMLQRGVVEPSEGPWSSPIVLVKKDGTTWFCVDFRKVNDVTKDTHPLPRIDDMLDTLGGAQWFTMLDLDTGKWRLPKQTARRLHFLHHQFHVMLFGLCNAPVSNGMCSGSALVHLPGLP